IANARDSDDLRDLQAEMIDRFGLLPDPVKNLFAMTALKLEATAIGITRLDLGANGGRIGFSAKPDIDPMTVIRLVQTQPNVYRMDGPGTLRIKRELWDADARFALANELLTRFKQR